MLPTVHDYEADYPTDLTVVEYKREATGQWFRRHVYYTLVIQVEPGPWMPTPRVTR